jgi:hypothetical protein
MDDTTFKRRLKIIIFQYVLGKISIQKLIDRVCRWKLLTTGK